MISAPTENERTVTGMDDMEFEVIRGTVDGAAKYCRIPIRRRRASYQDALKFCLDNNAEIDEMIQEYKDDEEMKSYLLHCQACLATAMDCIRRTISAGGDGNG